LVSHRKVLGVPNPRISEIRRCDPLTLRRFWPRHSALFGWETPRPASRPRAPPPFKCSYLEISMVSLVRMRYCIDIFSIDYEYMNSNISSTDCPLRKGSLNVNGKIAQRCELMERYLLIEPHAFNALPSIAQQYITCTLQSRWAVTNGFGWDSIKQWHSRNGQQCTMLCTFGSPSRDIRYIWVWNHPSRLFELHWSPYNNSHANDTDRIGPIVTTSDFNTFICHIQNDTIQDMDMYTLTHTHLEQYSLV
jgi:hypothetical protein